MRPWNPYAAGCPTRLVLDRVADKWAVLVLGLLTGGPVRFNRLRREIEGLSQKMLSQTLKSLERDGLVSRQAFPTVPVTVEYSITPLGQTLTATVDALRVWGERHMDEVLAAQRRYDAGAEPPRALASSPAI
ncbi:winged helix-turn-helix transcriptional regulator [Roseococcus sp.]|uniref:winged helix-turn-helix transcriptional regulator n=1 Tax=Roseococcus sp. TaxID=2109646 RepID=UPI003BAAD79F